MSAATVARQGIRVSRRLIRNVVGCGLIGLCVGAGLGGYFVEQLHLADYWTGIWTGSLATIGAGVGAWLGYERQPY